MNCIKCGKEIPDGEDKICEECKKNLVETIVDEEKKENKTKAKKKEAKSSNKEKKATKKENKVANENIANLKAACGILVAIIALVVIVCVIINIFKPKAVGNTIGNIRNYGYAAINKGYIYYLAPDETSKELGIFKCKTDGSDIQNLYMSDANLDILSINVYKNNVYFIGIASAAVSAEDELDNKIFKMDLNGNNMEVINSNEFNNDCYEIYVVDNKVYYIDVDSNVASMNLDGSNKKVVMENGTGYLGITDKYIIFNKINTESEDKDFVTYIANLDGSNERPILTGKRIYSVNVDGDTIIYTDSNKNIFSTQIDSNKENRLYDIEAFNLNVRDGYAYYLNYKNPLQEDYTVCLFRVKADGTSSDPELIKELDTYSSFIDVIDNKVMYMDSNTDEGFINLVSPDGSTVQLYTLNYEEYYQNMESGETPEDHNEGTPEDHAGGHPEDHEEGETTTSEEAAPADHQ